GGEEVDEDCVRAVGEGGRLRGRDKGHASCFGALGEGAIAVVVKEDVATASAGDVQVGIAVVVVVAPGRRHADPVPQTHAGLFGDIGEGPIAVVAARAV